MCTLFIPRLLLGLVAEAYMGSSLNAGPFLGRRVVRHPSKRDSKRYPMSVNSLHVETRLVLFDGLREDAPATFV